MSPVCNSLFVLLSDNLRYNRAMTTPDTTTQPAPIREKVLKNGTVMRNGRFVTGPDKSAPGVITTQNARTLAQTRWDKQRAAFAAGMIQAIKSTGMMPDGATGEAGAWQAIAERATTVMLDEQDAGRLARLLKTSADLAGYSQPKADPEQGGSVSDLFAAVPPGGLVMLVGRLRNGFDNNTYPNHEQSSTEQDGDVLDARATDAG